MKGNMEERARNLAEYIIEHDATVRKAAERFGVSKSTVHMDGVKWNGFGWWGEREILLTKYRKCYTIEANEKGCDMMAQVNIRMDDGIKAEAEQLFQQLGLNFSSAVNMFVLQAIREGGIPFAVTTKTGKSDAELLAQSMREEQEGKVITKTMEELRAMEE